MKKIETSLILTVCIVVLFFSLAIGITLVAPRFVDSSWLEPTSYYQVQMYEVQDPNYYISNTSKTNHELQYVQHVEAGSTLFSFKESPRVRYEVDQEFVPYITKQEDKELKLTTRLLLCEKVDTEGVVEVFRIYDPRVSQAFLYSPVQGALESFVDEDFILLDSPNKPWHQDPGVVFVNHPTEYRVRPLATPWGEGFQYDPQGKPIESLEQLTGPMYGFISRKDLIQEGEKLYAEHGCFYCHTDQTRTLIQDTVLNGSDAYPAPPSSANEYIYQAITFPGTKRNGPDLSRVGVKKPARDWHKSHFWSPKTVSPGSIMPSFQFFFDNDPRGTRGSSIGVPNRKFEAMYQYLMTKGTRITPPTKAWWLGKDSVNTLELIKKDKHK